jgi:hypothetical protein
MVLVTFLYLIQLLFHLEVLQIVEFLFDLQSKFLASRIKQHSPTVACQKKEDFQQNFGRQINSKNYFNKSKNCKVYLV